MISGTITSVVIYTKDRYILTVNGTQYTYYNNDTQLFPDTFKLLDTASRNVRVFFSGMYVKLACLEGSKTVHCVSVDMKQADRVEFTKCFSNFICSIYPESFHPCIKSMKSAAALAESCVLNALSSETFVNDIINFYKTFYSRFNSINMLKIDLLPTKDLPDDLFKYMNFRCIKKIVDTPSFSYTAFRKNPYEYLYPTSGNAECSKLFRALSLFAKAYKVSDKCHLNGAIRNALFHTMSEGNTSCSRRVLSANVKSKELLLGIMFPYDDITTEIDSNNLYFVYRDNVMFKWMYDKERVIAGRVTDLVDAYIDPSNSLQVCVDDHIVSFESTNSIVLNKKQKTAIKYAFASDSGVMILTGLPGTGKTSVIKCIEYIATEECIAYEMASPTGKSASKMGKNAKTVHRLLESVYVANRFTFLRNANNPLSADLVILDEVSMLDIELFYEFVIAIKRKCMIVLIGDNNQLPSVKCGDLLGSLIRCASVPHVHLSKLYRQGVGSHIPLVAKKVKDGEYLTASDLNNESISLIAADDEEDVKKHVLDFYTSNKKAFKTKILAPNNYVVDMLNADIHFQEYSSSTPMFECGEELICVSNEYGKLNDGSVDIDTSVFNGEFVTFDAYTDGSELVNIEKRDGGVRRKLSMKSKSFKYGYCITIHKSQGDEYDKVLLVLHNSPYKMLNKKLLYTALTRAKTHVTIISTMKCLRQCVDGSLERCDILESLIRDLSVA
jgi:hypothetical protein